MRRGLVAGRRGGGVGSSGEQEIRLRELDAMGKGHVTPRLER